MLEILGIGLATLLGWILTCVLVAALIYGAAKLILN